MAWGTPKVFGENRLNPICLSWDMDVRLGPFGVISRRTIGNITVSVWHSASVLLLSLLRGVYEQLLEIGTVNV